jgi:hypothetical protein
MLTPARVVTFLTPIFAAGAAAATPWLVKTFGLKITPTDVTALAVAGATSVTAVALKFLHGNSLWERSVAAVAPEANTLVKAANVADPGLIASVKAVVESEVAKVADLISPAAVIPLAGPVAVPPIPTPATPVPEAAA